MRRKEESGGECLVRGDEMQMLAACYLLVVFRNTNQQYIFKEMVFWILNNIPRKKARDLGHACPGAKTIFIWMDDIPSYRILV